MKKIILLTLAAVMMAGCSEESINRHTELQIDLFDFDSCEYLRTYGGYGEVNLAHKGNCRFCKERDSIKWEKRKKELEELVIKLKEK